ncbi:MAG: glycosyltransferase [Bacteroidetes bacterium]|nr:glycosyltransferase [Bacteroidota bacterium]
MKEPFSAAMESPTVTVVLCTYNGEKFIDQQLHPIRNQTYKNLVILISDDASTDGTWEQLKIHAAADSRIQLHQNKCNQGYNHNFSQACAGVETPLLAFADQDDLWHEEKIERLVRALRYNTPLIYCDSLTFTGNTPRTAPPKSLYRRFEGTSILQLGLYNTVNGHAILARTDFIKKTLPFPPHLFYDWYIAGRAALAGGVQYLPALLVYQRMHKSNASVFGERAGQKKTKLMHMVAVSAHCKAFAESPGITTESHQRLMEWITCLDKLIHQRKAWPSFVFMMRYRADLFYYKKRKIGWPSQLKHAIGLIQTYLRNN